MGSLPPWPPVFLNRPDFRCTEIVNYYSEACLNTTLNKPESFTIITLNKPESYTIITLNKPESYTITTLNAENI
jgi:hypothetical protein